MDEVGPEGPAGHGRRRRRPGLRLRHRLGRRARPGHRTGRQGRHGVPPGARSNPTGTNFRPAPRTSTLPRSAASTWPMAAGAKRPCTATGYPVAHYACRSRRSPSTRAPRCRPTCSSRGPATATAPRQLLRDALRAGQAGRDPGQRDNGRSRRSPPRKYPDGLLTTNGGVEATTRRSSRRGPISAAGTAPTAAEKLQPFVNVGGNSSATGQSARPACATRRSPN